MEIYTTDGEKGTKLENIHIKASIMIYLLAWSSIKCMVTMD